MHRPGYNALQSLACANQERQFLLRITPLQKTLLRTVHVDRS